MNDLAREALIEAAMNGVEQAIGVSRRLYIENDKEHIAFCATGVLTEKYRTLHSDTAIFNIYSVIMDFFEISIDEWMEIQQRNDEEGWSFLDIARKVGVKEEL